MDASLKQQRRTFMGAKKPRPRRARPGVFIVASRAGSTSAPATIDRHNDAGKIIARGRCEENDGAFEIAWLTPAIRGDAAEDFLGAHRVGLQRGGVVRAHVAGSDRVYLHAFAGPLVGERFGELADGALARGVAGHGDAAEEREQRGDVDDLAGAAGEHVFAGSAAGGEHAVEVHAQHKIPIRIAVIGGGGAFDNARVVHKDVEVALPRDRLLDEALHVGALTEVRLNRGGAASEFFHLGDNRRELGCIASIDDHIGAGLRERERHGASKPLRGAGDQRDFAIEAEFPGEIIAHDEKSEWEKLRPVLAAGRC